MFPQSQGAFTTYEPWTSLIDIDRARTDDGTVQCFDGTLRLTVVCHLDEGEPARLASIAVQDDMYFLYVAVRREEGAQLLLRGVEIQVADVNIFHGKPTFLESVAQVGQCVLPPGRALPIQRGCTFCLPEPRRISMMHKDTEPL